MHSFKELQVVQRPANASAFRHRHGRYPPSSRARKQLCTKQILARLQLAVHLSSKRGQPLSSAGGLQLV